MLDSLNLQVGYEFQIIQVGDEFQIIETDDGLILRPVRHDDHERQMSAARVVMDKCEAELQKLAK
ncbi:MAG: AbrB/MazE/SpoVT family DNA-binding domain-containing protein [Hyphomicrobiales bacterium]|nr:MAG: AbrB/MazE/SpoVT family DNA-binding domain-containing protein [Hyphomicrobiales bacterium]